MFRRSCRLAWTPNYFRHRSDRDLHPAAKAASKKRQMSDTVKTPKMGLAKSPHKLGENLTWVSSSHYVNTQFTRPCISEKEEKDSWRQDARERLVRTTQELHSEWEKLPSLLPEKARDDRQAYLSFQTRQIVLGPLSALLRAALPPQTGSLGGNPSKLYRVVENAEIVDGRALPLAQPASENTSSDLGITYFSLEDLVVFLDLYRRVESEDGQLLRLLLDEVNRFIFGNMMPLLGASSSESVRVRLPLPQLLFTLSGLGIAEEHILQAIVRRAAEKGAHPHSDDPKARGLLYANLPLYEVQDLLVLMIALYRFGLQQEYAFERTIKSLRVLMWRPGSPAARLQRTFRKLEAELCRRSGRESHDSAADNVETSGDEQPDPWFQHLPTLEKDLQCPLEVLVEAITALSMSVFRPRDVLALVANLLVVSAHAALRAVLRSSLISSSERKYTMLAISRQLHQAVHLYEEMNEPQPLLAELLAWSCTISKVGVLIDGGEDAAVPSERRAYYDHVTADLVKVNRA